ncbi:MAG: hypothetical protein AABZ08_10675 [Planctomycetota bacterium]
MPSRHQNIIVGSFVILGLVVLGGLIVVYGGGRTLMTKTYLLNVEFADGVTGVQGGQAVTLNGKRVGETTDIVFVDNARLEKGVRVLVTIEEFEIPVASEMIVSPPTMGLGKPLIEINVLDTKDTKKLPMDGTATIRGRTLPAIDQLVPKDMQHSLVNAATHIGELASALTPAAKNLTLLLEQRDIKEVDAKGLTATMATMIQRLDGALKSFNEVFGNAENQQNLGGMLANGKKMSESGTTAMQNFAEMTGDGKTLAKDMAALMRRLVGLSDDMSSVMKRLDTAVATMNTTKGTMGLMLNDNRLYEEMVLTMRRMQELAKDFQEVAQLWKKGKIRVAL